MLGGELDDLANLVFVYSAFNCGNQRYAEADLRQPIKRPELLIQEVGFAAKNAICLWVESIELKVKRRPYLV